jgi:hypothetical protein
MFARAKSRAQPDFATKMLHPKGSLLCLKKTRAEVAGRHKHTSLKYPSVKLRQYKVYNISNHAVFM